MIISRECAEGEMMPRRWYGLAYHDNYRLVAHFYPIPINYFVRWYMAARVLYDDWRGRPSWVDKQVEKRYTVRLKDLEDREKKVETNLMNSEIQLEAAILLYQNIKNQKGRLPDGK